MGEERQQGKHCHDVELDLIMHHPLWKRVQPEEEDAYAKHRSDENDSHDHEQNIGLAGRRYKKRQMV